MSNRVRQMRESQGTDLEDFAALVGVSTRYLLALEEDQCVVNVDAALRIAKTLNSTVEAIFGEEEEEVSVPKEPTSDVASSVVESNESDSTTLTDRADGCSDVAASVESDSTTLTDRADCCSNVAASVELGPEQENVEKKTSLSRPKKRAQSKKPEESEAKSKKTRTRSSAPDESTSGTAVAPYTTDLNQKTLGELREEEASEERSLFDGQESSDAFAFRKVYAPRRSQKISSNFSKTAKAVGLASSPEGITDPTISRPIRYFDLFCGIGGFRYAAQNTFAQMDRQAECVLSCDIDEPARQSYAENFGDVPFGDVALLPSEEIPDFDLLFAGFPCQTFSIIGLRKGFADETKGSLFFQIARILKDKRPRAFVLENVRQLTTHDKGRTFEIILRVLQEELGYYVDWRVLNALDCGVPQKRERVVVVGSTEPFDMEWPAVVKNGKSLSDILEDDKYVDKKHFASPEIVRKRKEAHQSPYRPAIWHENKSGNISSYPYSCALRAGASYNYLLVNGERRLTPREMLRLQGFPDEFKIVVSDTQIRKQAGNAAPVCLIQRALERFLPLVFENKK